MKRFIYLSFFLSIIFFSESLYSATTLYVSPSGSGTECSSSNPCSFDQALSTASSNDDDNTINLAAGTYSASTTSFTYTATTINHALTLAGAGEDFTFITSAVGVGNGIDFNFSGSVTVTGITVQKNSGFGLHFAGDPTGSSFSVTISNCTFWDNSGSGVWIENVDDGLNGTINISNNTFEGNATSAEGGGLHIKVNTALVTLPIQVSNNIFNRNHADTNGGAVWIYSQATNSPTTFQGNSLQNNYALNVAGGAYIQTFNSPMVIGGSTTSLGNSFLFNAGIDTGGIWSESQTGGTTFQNNTVIGNVGLTAGAAIVLRIYAGDVVFSNNIIQNNPNYYGGGFEVQTINTGNPITFVMNANLVSGNNATDFGGGSVVFHYLTSPASITNNIFVENFGASSSASTGGLGISSDTDQPQPINITNNTFANNSSNSFGGGLFLAPNNAAVFFNVYNNIFWENSSAYPQEADLYVINPIWTGMNLYNNDITSVCIDGTPVTCNSGSNFSTLANTTASSNLYNIDPEFVGTGDFVNFYSLQRNSPVIKQGDSNAPNLPTYDYTGTVSMDSPPDLGALQYLNRDTLSGSCALHNSERNFAEFFWIYAWILLLLVLKKKTQKKYFRRMTKCSSLIKVIR